VPEQKLNLLQFATRAMAKTGTSSTEIMRRKMIDANPVGKQLHRSPHNV
jgi:hypothetical protein